MKNKIVFSSRKFLDVIEFFGFSYLLLFWLSYCIEWGLGLNTNSSKQLVLFLIFTLHQSLNKFEEYNGTKFFDFPTPEAFYRQVIGSNLYYQE